MSYSLPKRLEGFACKLGDTIAGHNFFLASRPTCFDPSVARHFLFVESTMLVPTACLGIVHYLRMVCHGGGRSRIGPTMDILSSEGTKRIQMMEMWIDQIPPERRMLWKGITVVYQALTFPLWFLVAGVSPFMAHGAMARADFILHAKYATVHNGFPRSHVELLHSYAAALLSANQFHSEAAVSLQFSYIVAIIVILYFIKFLRN